MGGCDWNMKRFNVSMSGKVEENKCWDCKHHKYNGGEGLDGKVCPECEKYSNYKEVKK